MLALDPNLISSDISAEGATMGDVLIRDVPDDVLTALEGLAARLGLSRSEYIRRRLAQDARTARIAVTGDDLRRFADTFSDLGDAEVMARAWDD